MICAFGGWNDAADAASSTVGRIVDQLGAERFARIDAEEFFDYQRTRPQIAAADDDGDRRRIVWPEVVVYAAHLPQERRDLLLIAGPEPALRWRTFSAALVELCETLGVQLAVTLGAVLADVPHTRPVIVTGMVTDEALGERVGIDATSYEGATGITGVLHAAFDEAGIPAASIWAAVPHYVAATSNPCAALSLMHKTSRVVRLPLDLGDVRAEAEDFRNRLDVMIDADPELRAMVDRLEAAANRAGDAALPPGELPDGDALAEDFQRFLQQVDDDERG